MGFLIGWGDRTLGWRGKGERSDQSVPAPGKALLQDSFIWDHQTLFFSPNCGAWDRENLRTLYFVPRSHRTETKGRMSFVCFLILCSHCALKAQLEGQVPRCPSSFPSSVDSTPSSFPPALAPLLLSRIQTEEMFSSCFLKGVRLLSSFSPQPGSV